MTNKEDSWGESFFMLLKMNLFILILVIALTYVGNHVLVQPMNLHDKLFLLGSDIYLILVAIVFEVFRVCKEEEQKEKAWRRRISG
jgi:hypothetical protein